MKGGLLTMNKLTVYNKFVMGGGYLYHSVNPYNIRFCEYLTIRKYL